MDLATNARTAAGRVSVARRVRMKALAPSSCIDMKPKWPTEAIVCALLIFTGCVAGQTFVNTEVEDINTVLMQSTFRIHGPAVDGTGTSVGTVFIVGRPIKDQPKRGAYVLVTAAHVLQSIKGDTGTLLLRQKNSDGAYKPF